MAEKFSKKREYVAEVLEARILYSGAPVGAAMVADEIPVEDLSGEKTEYQFESLNNFGEGALITSDGAVESPSEGAELVVLSNFNHLTPAEIKELAKLAVDYWGNDELDQSQRDALLAIEVALVDIGALAEPGGFEVGIAESDTGDGVYVDSELLNDDGLEGASAFSTVPQESEQYGLVLIRDLLQELGNPVALERMATQQIAQRTVAVPLENQPLTLSTLEMMADAAEQHWVNSGLTQDQIEALHSIEYHIVDLDGAALGYAEGSHVYIDHDAAEQGWFIDSTPLDLSEIGFDGFDLVSVVSHEVGHVLGLEDAYGASERTDIMYAFIMEGERRAPEQGDAEGAVVGSIQGPAFITADPDSYANLNGAETLTASADAYVDKGAATSNYETSDKLRIKYDSASDNNRKAYVQFDLASLGFDHATSLGDATLSLDFVDSAAGTGGSSIDWDFEVFGLTDGDEGEGWGESTINWSNAPANDTSVTNGVLSNATSLGTFTLTGRTGQVDFQSEALTDFVGGSTSDDRLTFIIVRNTDQPGSENTYIHAIGSKEHSSGGAKLILTPGPHEDRIFEVSAADGVLQNDLSSGTTTVTGYDSISALGASVKVNDDGSFTYDPTFSAELQGLLAGQSVSDTFQYTATDDDGTATGTVAILVTGADDAPVLGTDPAIAFTENGDSVFVAPNLTLEDADTDATADGDAAAGAEPEAFTASAEIISGFVDGEDSLAVGDLSGLNITATISGNGSRIDFAAANANVTMADFQAALRLVTFSNSEEDPDSAATREIAFNFNDGTSDAVGIPIVATFNFDDRNLAVDITPTNLTVSDITKGAGAQLKGPDHRTPAYPTPLLSVAPAVNMDEALDAALALEESIDKGIYIEFTVQANDETYSLDSLSFDIARGYSTGIRGYAVFASTDGFASPPVAGEALVLEGNVDSVYNRYNSGNLKPIEVDLSVAAFQNLSVDTTFRIYIHSPETPNDMDFDNLVVKGTVAGAGPAAVPPTVVSISPVNDAPVAKDDTFNVSEDGILDGIQFNNPGYAAEVIASDPILFWELGDTKGDGNTAVNSATGVSSLGTAGDGTYRAAVGDVSDTEIETSSGASFGSTYVDPSARTVGDGVGVSFSSSNPFPSSTLTLEGWYRGAATNTQVPLFSYDQTANEFLVFFNADGNSTLQIYIDNTAYLTTITKADLFDGQWHHFAVTWDNSGGDLKAYIDGVEAWSRTGAKTGYSLDTEGTLFLGQEQDGEGAGFDNYQKYIGDIDEVAVYNRALSADEIARHVDNRKSINLLVNDTDAEAGDSLTIDISGGATITSTRGASVTLQANGDFVYDPSGSAELQGLLPGQSVDDTFTYTVIDGNGGSDVGTAIVTVGGAADAPVIASTTTTLTFTEGDGPTAVNPGLSLTDPDVDADADSDGRSSLDTSNYVASATVTSGFAAGDQLAAGTISANLEAVVSADKSTVTITARNSNATLADFEAALQNITFWNDSDDPVTSPNREISYQFFDGVHVTNPATSLTLASWDFNQGSADFGPDVTGSGFTISDITPGNVANFKTQNDGGYPSQILGFSPTDTSSPNLASAVANNTYVEFTISATAPPYTLTGLAFDVSKGAASGPRGISIRFSDDDFAGNIIEVVSEDITTHRSSQTSFDIDLTTFEGLANLSGDLKARIYVYAPDNGRLLEFDNLELTGEVSGSVVVDTAVVAVNDAPALDATPSMTLSEGDTVTVTSATIGSPSDPDNLISDLTVTVSEVTCGQFERVAAAGTGITTFTVDEVESGAIQFVHDGGEDAPTYFVTVADNRGAKTIATAATITFSNLNDDPVADDDTNLAVEAGGSDNGTTTVGGDGSTASGTSGNVFGVSGELALTNATLVSGIAYGGSSIAATLNDDFAYDPQNPTAYLPDMHFNNLGHSIGFHNDSPTDEAGVIEYDITSTTLNGSNEVVIDLYGRSDVRFDSDDDFDIEFLDENGAVLGAATSLAIPDSGVKHLRVSSDGIVPINSTIEKIRITGRDSNSSGDNNFFAIMEVRAAVVDDFDPDSGDIPGTTVTVTNVEYTGGGTQFSDTGSGPTHAGGSLSGETSIDGRWGTLTINPDGSYTYLLDRDATDPLSAGDTAVDEFTYTIADGENATDTASLTITVQGSNDAPTANDDSGYATDEETAITIPTTDYANTVLDDSPIGYYRLGDSSASEGAMDEIAGNDGVYVQTESGDFGQTGALIEDPDTAVTFQGGDHVLIDSGVFDDIGSADAFSIELWFQTGGFGRQDLFNLKGSGGDLGIWVEDGDATGTKLRVHWNGKTIIPNDGSVGLNDWHHLVFTRTADGDATLYVDGSVYGTGTTSSSLSAIDGSIRIGTNHDGSGNPTISWNGGIDEVAFYASDLSVDQVQAHFEAAAFSPRPVLANDNDIDRNDRLEVVAYDAISAAGASVTQNTDGEFVYDPNGKFEYLAAGEEAADTFTYTVSDTSGATNTATVTVTITGINDAVTANDDSGFAVTEDDAAANTQVGNLTANDTDVDIDGNSPNDTPTVVGISNSEAGDVTVYGTGTTTIRGTYGSLAVDFNGDFTYTLDNANAETDALNAGEVVQDSFTYTVADREPEELAYYSFNNGSASATRSNSAIGAGDVTRHNTTDEGDTTGSGVDIFISSSTHMSLIRGEATAADQAGALADDDYFEFTITPTDGGPVTLTSLDFLHKVDGSGSPSNTSVLYFTSSVNGYTSLLHTSDAFVQSYGGQTQSTLRLGSEFENLTEAVTFRYTFSDNSSHKDFINRLDDLTVNGLPAGGSMTVDTATLDITVNGANDAPMAVGNLNVATEAGGTNNAIPGSDATGNVITDPSGGAPFTGVQPATGTTVDGFADPTAAQVLNSITIDGVTYTNIAGAVSATSTTGTIYYADGDAAPPADRNAALSGLTLSNIVTNSGTTEYTLATTVNDTSVAFFLGEIGTPETSADSITVTPLDAEGKAIGTWTLAITSGDYGAQLGGMDTQHTSILHTSLTSFTVDDFTGGTGSLTGVAGLRLTGNSGYDPNVAGTVNVASLDADRDIDSNDTVGASAATDLFVSQVNFDGGADQAVTAGTTSANGTVIAGAYGTLTIGSDGSYVYTGGDNLDPGQVERDVFTYTLSDDSGATDTATLAITVSGVEDAPTAVDDTVTAIENGAVVTIPVTANDYGIDPSDTHSVIAPATTPAGVTLTVSGLDIEYDPSSTTAFESLAAGETVTDTFTYFVTDGRTVPDAAVMFDANSLTLGNMNAQGGGSGLAGSWGGGTATIHVVDTELTYAGYNVTQSTGGNSRAVQGDYHQFKNLNRALTTALDGEVWFSYLVQNPVGEGAKGGLIFNESDANNNSNFQVLANGTGLQVKLPDGTNTTVAGQFTEGVTSLVVGRLNIGAGANDTIDIWVDPDLINGSAEGPAYSGTGDFGDNISRLGIVSWATNATWNANTGGATEASIVDAIRMDNSAYAVIGADAATVKVTVEGSNDAPEITGGPDTVNLPETNAPLSTSGSLTVSDVDTSDVVTSAVSLVVSGDDPSRLSEDELLSLLTITPAAPGEWLSGTETTKVLNWTFDSGTETFDYLAEGKTLILTYTVTATDDAAAPLSDSETVTITITGTNDAPVATNNSYTVNQHDGIVTIGNVIGDDTGDGSDSSNDEYIVYSETFSGSGSLNGTTTELGGETWVSSGWNADGTKAADGSAWLPFEPDSGKVYTLSATLDVLTGSSSTEWIGMAFAGGNGSGGVATNNGAFYSGNNTYAWLLNRVSDSVSNAVTTYLDGTNGGASYDPNPNLVGETEFEMILDTRGTSNWKVEFWAAGTKIRTVDLAADPDAINWIGFGGNADTARVSNFRLTVDEALTVAEVNGQTSGVGTPVTLASGRQITVNADGTFQYQSNDALASLAPGEEATDTFTYTVRDEGGLTDRATVTVVITGQNDAPVAEDDVNVAEEAGGVGNLTLGIDPTGNVIGSLGGGTGSSTGDEADTDAEGDTLYVAAVTFAGTPFAGAENYGGTVSAGDSIQVDGAYGTLTFSSDGSYSYAVNQEVADSLDAGDMPMEEFTYLLADREIETKTLLEYTFDGGSRAPDVDPSVSATSVTINGDVAVSSSTDMAYQYTNKTAATKSAALDGASYLSFTITPQSGETVSLTHLQFDVGGEDDPYQNVLYIQSSLGGFGSANPLLHADDAFVQNHPDGVNVSSDRYLRTKYLILDDPQFRNLTEAVEFRFYFSDDVNTSTQINRIDNIKVMGSTDDTGVDSGTLLVTVAGANDSPVAVDDTTVAVEAGISAGSTGTGNVLDNDTDVDEDDAGNLEVATFGFGDESGDATTVVGGSVAGNYGSLTIDAGGNYTYTVNDGNATVEALAPGETLTETFVYVVKDPQDGSGAATLTVTIQGANDAPVANADGNFAVEAGGAANTTVTVGGDGITESGTSGNVLDNDTDRENERLYVTSVTFDGVTYDMPEGSLEPVEVTTLYGTLTMASNGEYTYTLDHGKTDFLSAGQNEVESFTYTVADEYRLVAYTLNGNGNASGVHSAISANTLKLVDTVKNESGNTDMGFSGDGNTVYQRSNATASDLTGALDGDEYLEFTITPKAGETITLTSLNFATGGEGNAFQNVAYWQSDIDGFGSTNPILHAADAFVHDHSSGGTETAPKILLLGSQFTDLTTAVTFRLYLSDNADTEPQRNRIDNIVVNGFVGSRVNATSTLEIEVQGANDAPVAVDNANSAMEAGGLDNSAELAGGDGSTMSGTSGNVMSDSLVTEIPLTNPSLGNTLNDSFNYDPLAPTDPLPTVVWPGGYHHNSIGDAVLTYDLDSSVTVEVGSEFVVDLYGRNSNQNRDNDIDIEFLNESGEVIGVVTGLAIPDTATPHLRVSSLGVVPVGSTIAGIRITGHDSDGNTGDNNSFTLMEIRAAHLQSDVDVDGSFAVSGISFSGTTFSGATDPSEIVSSGASTAIEGAYGILEIEADGSYTYLLDEGATDSLDINEVVSDVFTYTIFDGDSTDTASLTIAITGASDRPKAVNDHFGNGTADDPLVREDDGDATLGNLISNSGGGNPGGGGADSADDSDVDESATLSIGAVEGSAANVGTGVILDSGAEILVNADGSVSYNPNGAFEYLNEGETYVDTFEYTLTDGALTRFVVIQNNGTEDRRLDMGEIEVFGVGVIPLVGNASSDGDLNPSIDLATSANGASVYDAAAESNYIKSHGANSNLIDGAEETGGNTWGASGVGTYIIIDLGAAYDVDLVRIHQRNDSGAQDRLRDFTVTLLADDGTGNPGGVVDQGVYSNQVPTNSHAEFEFSSKATGTVTVTGQNDAPVAMDDVNFAVEAGGTNNADESPGGDGTTLGGTSGSVLSQIGTTLTLSNPVLEEGASGHDGSIDRTIDDSFSYDPEDPTVNLPNQFFDSAADGFHNVSNTDAVIRYEVTPVTLDGDNQVVVDLYGRNQNYDRDNDIDVQFLAADGTTVLGEVTGVAIPDSGANPHLRVSSLGFVPTGSTIEYIRVIGHDSGSGTSNAFTLMEIRAAELVGDYDIDSDDQTVPHDGTVNVTNIAFSGTPFSTAHSGGEVIAGTDSSSGTQINGAYGTLTIGADGTYIYTVNEAVMAGIDAGIDPVDVFTYTLSDDQTPDGASDTATLTITVQSRDDVTTVVYVNDDWTGTQPGAPITDADLETTAEELAHFGSTAFDNLVDAVSALSDAPAGSTIIVNAGTYGDLDLSGLSNSVTVKFVEGASTIDSLTGAATATIQLGGVDGTHTIATTLTVGDADSTIYSGIISGTGNLAKAGTGTLTLRGNNTYTGTTTINDGGTLNLQTVGTSSYTYRGGDIYINGGSTLQISTIGSGGALQYWFGNKNFIFDSNGGGTIDTTSRMNWVVYGGSTVTTNGGAQNSIIGSSGINLHNADTLNFDVADGTDSVNLVVSTKLWNGGGVSKTGDGIMELSASNTYTGATTVDQGTLLVNGSHNGAGDYTVAAGANLGGDESILFASGKLLTANGGLAPGDPFLNNGVGTLTISGDDTDPAGTNTVNLAGTFDFQINGDTSADLLNVTGTVTVGGTLNLSEISDAVGVAGGVTAGGAIVLIQNDGTDAVSGMFTDLPEGATVRDDDGDSYIISYAGGDGNDVVLFVGAAETEVTLDGSGNLTITDINRDSADNLTISYDDTTDEYVIMDALLNLSAVGFDRADLYRPDAKTVRIAASAVTGIVTVNTSFEDGDAQTDSVTIGGTTAINFPGSLEVNAERVDVVGVVSATGAVTLNGSDSVTMQATASITATGGVTLNASAAGGTVTMADGALVDAGTGNIDIDAGSHVTLGGLKTTGAGLVSVDSATGNILDGGDTHPDVSAPNAVLNAGLDVGTAANPLETDIDNLEGTSGGDFVIINTGTLNIGGASGTASGLDVGGNLDLTSGNILIEIEGEGITAGGEATLNAGHHFRLDTDGSISAGGAININIGQLGVDDTEGFVELLGEVDAGNGANEVNITGGNKVDTFNIVPSKLSVIHVDGGGPSHPVTDGDILNIIDGINPQRTETGQGEGFYSFGGGQLKVNYTDIERDSIPTLEIDIPISQRLFPTTVNGVFTDYGLSDSHTLTIDWKDPDGGVSTFAVPSFDGGLNAGMVIASSSDGMRLKVVSMDSATGEVEFAVSHTYQRDGLYDVVVTVIDSTDARVAASQVAEVYFLAPDENGTGGFFSFANLPGRFSLSGFSSIFNDLRLERLFATDFEGNDISSLSGLGETPLVEGFISLEGEVRVIFLDAGDRTPIDLLTALNQSILKGTPLDFSGNALPFDSQEVLQMITDLIQLNVDGVTE